MQRSLGCRLESLTRTTRNPPLRFQEHAPGQPSWHCSYSTAKIQLLPICEPYSLNQQGSLKNKPILVVMPEWGKEELHSKRGQAESTLRAQHSGNVEEEIAKMRHDSRYVPGTAKLFQSASALEWIMEAEHTQRILGVCVRNRSCINQLFSSCFVNVDSNIELHPRGFVVD